ncbi:MAG TPA: hypothetical protein VH418_00025 [Solirubrobacteraceae bacterium]|jgi:hypothetical protein
MPALIDRHELADARESLAYWEERSRRLPRYAVRQRREARELARRWRGRVAEAERARYGAGVLGALLMFAMERRLPHPTRHAGRVVARWSARAFVALTVTLLALAVLWTVAVVEVLAALLHALT